MKKLACVFMIAAAGFFVSKSAVAQETFGNAGIEIALPVGDWSDAYSFGVGGSGGAEIGITDNFALTGNVGIVFLAVDDALSDFIASSFLVPIQVGGRAYFDEQRAGLFAEVKAGIHMFSVKTEDMDLGPLGTIEGESTTESYFSLAPQLGFFLTENISLSAKYQLIFVGEDEEAGIEGTTNSYIGVKGAYNF